MEGFEPRNIGLALYVVLAVVWGVGMVASLLRGHVED